MKHEVTISSSGMLGNEAMVILEDGTILKNVVEATIFIIPGELVRADLVMLVPQVVVKVAVTTINFHCPVCEKELEHHCDSDTLGGT